MSVNNPMDCRVSGLRPSSIVQYSLKITISACGKLELFPFSDDGEGGTVESVRKS
ncbi:hypothetical protein B7P43_G04563 [Cryptotermes secundus]|uniref:Uncharacterized protein n=1 Tax=Cryptotermes secundus TaxID=105785 RepID=A0A2J7QLL9_9NEOP|nr:hypothetical protein B7P43_G04563 [Cryptotermes secundus]